MNIIKKSRYRWLLDLGHGGINEFGKYTTGGKKMYSFTNVVDPKTGKKPLTIYEGDINRRIGAALVRKLSEANVDYDIISAPVEDTSLAHRLVIANNIMSYEKPVGRQCMLLSIHNNASGTTLSGAGRKASGCELWTSIGEDVSDLMAEFFANEYLEKWNKKYGPFRSYTGKKGSHDKENDFTMLLAPLPSVLVECGFYDNKKDALLMKDPEWIEDMATWLFDSIMCIENSDQYLRWKS